MPVVIRWLSRKEMYSLTFLISGLCNRGDTSNLKATAFLTEGLKIVQSKYKDTIVAVALLWIKNLSVRGLWQLSLLLNIYLINRPFFPRYQKRLSQRKVSKVYKCRACFIYFVYSHCIFFFILESQLPLHDVIRTKTFFVKLKTYILLHLVDVYMLRSDYDEAEKVCFKFKKWIILGIGVSHFPLGFI